MSLTVNTPVEDHRDRWGLWVKREDLCCPPPGPPFSKMRGVMAHVASRPEQVIGVLDTGHSQAGHAVAYACQELGKECVNFFPVRKGDALPQSGTQGLWPKVVAQQQQMARALGAEMITLPAGRSAILFHQAKKALLGWDDAYMMPNALKLPEMIEETAAEARRTFAERRYDRVIVACSSATIAAGVMRGYLEAREAGETDSRPHFFLHQGYDRPHGAMNLYINSMLGDLREKMIQSTTIISEGYGYADKARPGPTPDWPCNDYYDLKAFRWWVKNSPPRDASPFQTLFWNIG